MLCNMSVTHFSQIFLMMVLALDWTMIAARDRANSKMIKWNVPESSVPEPVVSADFVQPISVPRSVPEEGSLVHLDTPNALAAREERKLIFINNKAYDLSDSEQAKIWDLYMNKVKEDGQLIKHHILKPKPQMDSLKYVLKPKPQMDSLESALNGDLISDMKPKEEMDLQQADTIIGNVAHVDIDVIEGREEPSYSWLDLSQIHEDPSTRLGLASDYEEHIEPMKMSRFVADPEKENLIEYVSADEVKKLYEKPKTTTTTPPSPIVDRVDTDVVDKEESTDVHYEYTQHSMLQLLWNELLNIGDILGREMLDNLGSFLTYIWESLVNYVTARTTRSIRAIHENSRNSSFVN